MKQRADLEQDLGQCSDHVQHTRLVPRVQTGCVQHLNDEAHRLLQHFLALASRSVQQRLRRHRRVEKLLVHV